MGFNEVINLVFDGEFEFGYWGLYSGFKVMNQMEGWFTNFLLLWKWLNIFVDIYNIYSKVNWEIYRIVLYEDRWN